MVIYIGYRQLKKMIYALCFPASYVIFPSGTQEPSAGGKNCGARHEHVVLHEGVGSFPQSRFFSGRIAGNIQIDFIYIYIHIYHIYIVLTNITYLGLYTTNLKLLYTYTWLDHKLHIQLIPAVSSNWANFTKFPLFRLSILIGWYLTWSWGNRGNSEIDDEMSKYHCGPLNFRTQIFAAKLRDAAKMSWWGFNQKPSKWMKVRWKFASLFLSLA